MELRLFWKFKWILYTLIYLFLLFGLGFLFFNSYLVALLTAGLGSLYINGIKSYTRQTYLRQIEKDFVTFIYSLASYIGVGRSFEHSFHQSILEMEKDKGNYPLLEDLKRVQLSLEVNLSIGQAMKQLSSSYPVETILHFTYICERMIVTGGSLEEVIDMTIQMIRQKVEVEKELDLIVTQKRFELIIMLSFVPLMILYLRAVSGSFYEMMYQTINGRMIMTIALFLYLASGYFGKRIIDIEI